jgi:hypothetical protein
MRDAILCLRHKYFTCCLLIPSRSAATVLVASASLYCGHRVRSFYSDSSRPEVDASRYEQVLNMEEARFLFMPVARPIGAYKRPDR